MAQQAFIVSQRSHSQFTVHYSRETLLSLFFLLLSLFFFISALGVKTPFQREELYPRAKARGN
jgi:hypothetical protein